MISSASLNAAGEVLAHQPWAGVLLSAGLMFAAVCWMLAVGRAREFSVVRAGYC